MHLRTICAFEKSNKAYIRTSIFKRVLYNPQYALKYAASMHGHIIYWWNRKIVSKPPFTICHLYTNLYNVKHWLYSRAISLTVTLNFISLSIEYFKKM